MNFLNGFKTILGVVGTVVSVVVPNAAPAIGEASPHIFAVAQGVFGTLLALGVIHKAEKRAAR